MTPISSYLTIWIQDSQSHKPRDIYVYVYERCELYSLPSCYHVEQIILFVCRLVFSLSHSIEARRDPHLMISFRSKSETTESGESVHEEAESTI